MPSVFLPAAVGFGASQLFGGGGGGGQTTGQGISPTSTLTHGQRGILDQIINFAGPSIGQAGRVPPSRFGPPGASALQQQAFGLAGQLPQQFSPGQIQQNFQPTADFARQGFQQETIPAIMAALGRSGTARSSGAANILGREGRNLELGLASQLGQQQFSNLDRLLQVPGQVANIGSLQRGIESEGRQFGLSQFLAADPFRSGAVNLGLQSAGIPAQENIAFQGFRQPSTLESILPAAGQIFGGLAQGGFF